MCNFSIFIFFRLCRTVGIMNDFIVIVQCVPLGGVYKTLPPSPAPYATPYRDSLWTLHFNIYNWANASPKLKKKNTSVKNHHSPNLFWSVWEPAGIVTQIKVTERHWGICRVLFTKLRAERLMQVPAKFSLNTSTVTWVSYLSSAVSPCLLTTLSLDG